MPQTGKNTSVVRGLEKRKVGHLSTQGFPWLISACTSCGALLMLSMTKACDLCHIKKIRCDARRPTCSHCVVYDSQCTYTPHIKRRRKEVQIQPK
jgi:hypothetical protein